MLGICVFAGTGAPMYIMGQYSTQLYYIHTAVRCNAPDCMHKMLCNQVSPSVCDDDFDFMVHIRRIRGGAVRVIGVNRAPNKYVCVFA